jgi:hypothetical protein
MFADIITSIRVSWMTFPDSRVAMRAISSLRSRSNSAARFRILPRSSGKIARQVLNPCWAAASALSRSVSVACGTCPITSSVAGLMTGEVLRPSDGNHAPPISSVKSA